MADFRERLIALRNSKGLTQRALARLVGIPRDRIAAWELGRAQPPLQSMSRLADFFGVSLDYLTGRSDDPTPPRQAEEGRDAPAEQQRTPMQRLADGGIIAFLRGQELTEEDVDVILAFLAARKLARRRRKKASAGEEDPNEPR